jgi:hypothetical protein
MAMDSHLRSGEICWDDQGLSSTMSGEMIPHYIGLHLSDRLDVHFVNPAPVHFSADNI